MYSATFIFAKKQFDDAFHRLDQTIAEAAKSLPGYLGEETWENVDNGLVSNVYYWESLESLQALIRHPLHQQAKAGQANWLDGYKVVISQVVAVARAEHHAVQAEGDRLVVAVDGGVQDVVLGGHAVHSGACARQAVE